MSAFTNIAKNRGIIVIALAIEFWLKGAGHFGKEMQKISGDDFAVWVVRLAKPLVQINIQKII